MTTRATGTFDVTLNPLPLADNAPPMLGRLSIDKHFEGDLQAISRGEMLSAGTAVQGSGHVAIERVAGTLHGRAGDFVLQHSGTMARGVGRLDVTVVPDSGTGELEGLTGTMVIDASSNTHAYAFEYGLPSSMRGSGET